MKKKQDFFKTISANPYNDSYYISTSSQIKTEKKVQFQKEQFAVSFLKTQDFITTHIDISKHIPQEDIRDTLENKIYEELSLDMATEYHIDYTEAPNSASSDGMKNYQVFVVDPLNLDESFAKTIEKIKYIDQILPAPLLLRTLYKKDIIQDNGTHCFIYFQHDDAFLTIYDYKEYLYTKSIKYSFLQMHERFCELLGEQIEFSEFTRLLCEEGVKSSEDEKQKYLIKLFGEMFLHINDVITYSKRVFELNTIDEVYIGSEKGLIVGIDEYSKAYLGFDSCDFDFDYGYETQEEYIDQMHLLMHLTNGLEEEDRYNCNFTKFYRPPPFAQRASGKLILSVAAGIILALLYPAWFWTLDSIETVKKLALESEYKDIHKDRVKRENSIKTLTSEMNKVKALVDSEKKALEDKKSVLTQIHNVKVNYPMKAKDITDLTKYLNKYNVKLSELTYTQDKKTQNKQYLLYLVASKDKRITDLIEWYTKTQSKKYKFTIEKIILDEKSKMYYSELKVVLK